MVFGAIGMLGFVDILSPSDMDSQGTRRGMGVKH